MGLILGQPSMFTSNTLFILNVYLCSLTDLEIFYSYLLSNFIYIIFYFCVMFMFRVLQSTPLDLIETGKGLKFQAERPHLVSLGSGRLSTAITLLPLAEGEHVSCCCYC